MKKILLYTSVAMILGLLVTLVPLIATAEVKPNNHYLLMPEYVLGQTEKHERAYFSDIDLRIFAISFIVASAVYILLKRRTPYTDFKWVRRL